MAGISRQTGSRKSQRKGRPGRRDATVLVIAVAAIACLLVPSISQARVTHRFKETFGSAAQPTFHEPGGLAVAPVGAPDEGDLYVAELGFNEVQTVTIEGGPTGGSLKLAFEGCETDPLTVSGTTSPSAESVEAALTSLPCVGNNLSVDKSGVLPGTVAYTVMFVRQLGAENQPEINCDGSALTGGSSPQCTVATKTQGKRGAVRRFKADGTPDEFSALGSNSIEGLAFAPHTQSFVHNSHYSQIAVAPPGAAGGTAGDIYVAEYSKRRVAVFASSGAFLGYLEGFEAGPDAEGPAMGFNENLSVTGVGVDSTGVLYVTDGKMIHRYVPTSNPPAVEQNVKNVSNVGSSAIAAGTGASAGSIFTTNFDTANPFIAGLYKFNAETLDKEYRLQPYLDSRYLNGAVSRGVVVDPESGNVLSAREVQVDEFDASGQSSAVKLDSFDAEGPVQDMAVGPDHLVYVTTTNDSHVEVYEALTLVEPKTGSATEVGKSSSRLNGTLNDESTQVTECFFEYGTTKTYGSVAPCATLDGGQLLDSSEIPVDNNDHAVTASIGGLGPNTVYHYRLVTANANGKTEGSDETLETLGPPVITEESVTGVTSTSALVGGKVDPRGELTSFQVEYVTQAQFEASGYAGATVVPVPAQSVGSGVGAVAVSRELSGLTPGTAYRARIVATNQTEAPVHGQDLTFATYPKAGGLPDERAYEMVTPAAKGGEVYPREGLEQIGGTCDNKCLPGAERAKMPMQARADGKAVAYEGQPFYPGFGSEANEYIGERDPSSGWGIEPLSKPNYRTNSPNTALQVGGFRAFSEDLSRGVVFQADPALSSVAPAGYANLYLWSRGSEALEPLITAAPPNRPADGPAPPRFLPIFGGANAGEGAAAAFSHVIFEANDALTSATPTAPAPSVEPQSHAIYEWLEGQLRLVSVLPGNAAAAPDAVIGSGHLLSNSPELEGPVFHNAISADGSRIYWTSKTDGHLYVRIEGKETRQIPGAGRFLTASRDGGKVLLSDGRIYDLAAKKATDLTVGKGGFLGTLGTSDDLTRVYFVDEKALTPATAVNANGEHAEDGADNLYAWREGARTFLGQLLPRDNESFSVAKVVGTWTPSQSARTAQVSADGRFLAFNSVAPLTGYDNRQAQGQGCRTQAGQSCSQVYEYDEATGELSCASCNPSGERPLGYSNLTLMEGGAALFFPQARNLTDDGRLFFESQDRLSAADQNGHIQDVYEWAPPGVAKCTQGTGCTSLISTGQSPVDSQFLDATPSASDVFFTTRQRLLPQRDRDDYLDLYDARVHGGIDEAVPTPCEGEACRGPVGESPAAGTPATSSFSGPGNPKPKPPCRKGKVRRHGKCVKKPHRKHHHHRKHRRSSK